MADFDLSLVVRAKDEGAAATGDNLARSIDKVTAAQGRAATAGSGLANTQAINAEKAKAAAAALAAQDGAARKAAAGIGVADAATRRAAQGNTQFVAQMRASSIGAGQLSSIMRETAASIASGISPLAGIATQSVASGTAMGGLTSKVGGAGAILAGVLAPGLTLAIGLLVSFIFKSKDAGEAQKKFGEGMDFASLSAKELIKSIGELEGAQRRAIRSSYDSEQASLADANAALAAARAKREEAKAILELMIARASDAPQGFSEASMSVRGGLNAQVEGARKQLAEITAGIGKAEQLVKVTRAPILQREIAALTDETAAATKRYDDALFTLNRRFYDLGTVSEAFFKAESVRLGKLLEAEKKLIQERERKPRRGPRDPFAGRDLADFGRPIEGGSITSGYGQRVAPTAGASTNHLGLDFSARFGQAILATMDGVVKRAGGAGGYGNQIQLGHGGGTETRYSHLSRFNVQDGQAVKKGDVIGFAGKTGTATGVHLHYEVLVNGKKVNPNAGKFPFDPAEVGKIADAAAERLENFGERASEGIARINAQFDDQPRLIDAAAKATADLDRLIKELGDSKPIGFEALIADAERAKVVVREGINRPYNDFIQAQAESLAVQKLITEGRTDEAEAMRTILSIERQSGPLTAERRDAILASVQALRAEGEQLERNRERQQAYLDQLGAVKSAVQDIFNDPIQGLKDLPKRLIAAAGQFKVDQLFESLFGETFRELEDQITGANTAKDASDRLGRAVDSVTASARRVESAFNGVAGAANGQAAGGGVDPLAPLPEGVDGDIVVTGRRPTGLPQILEKLSKGIGISDAGAAKLGQVAGKGLAGAATGAMTDSLLKPLGKALGFKTSAVGAQIGGAIGSFIPIPGGDIIGSIIGSVVGGLFKKTKKGSSTITNVFDDPNAVGNFKGQTSALASGIQDTLLNIADTLGGGLGNFAVSIGKRKDKFVVDPTGKGRLKTGVKKFDDEEDAIKFAILDAIKDGAVTGLSDAVKKALQSSDDLERSLREALKVRDLEDLIGGLGNTLSRYFKDFDRQAAERVRLARKYGLDLVAVERINSEERAKLVEQLVISRIGGLTKFRDDMKFGDLFEGDASTRRGALLGEINKVQAQAEAGSDGAADQLADLYRQLIETSKEAFGTAGPELTNDRALAASGVDRVIEMENARIAQAQLYNESALAAANQNNALTNETNDLLARQNAILDRVLGGLFGGSSGGGGAGAADLTMIGARGYGGGGAGGRFTGLDVQLV